MELSVIKDEAVKFCSILAEVFGDDLDRKTLWERIGNGLIVSSAKSGGDWELFVNEMLKFIKADPGKVAANRALSSWIEFMLVRPKEWQEQFLRVCESKHMFICVKARTVWNLKKSRPQETDFIERVSDDGFTDDIPEVN
jgi:hypothetical protein